MADRYSGFVVTLDQDLPEDDARRVRDALRMIRGVINVEPVVAPTADRRDPPADTSWIQMVPYRKAGRDDD